MKESASERRLRRAASPAPIGTYRRGAWGPCGPPGSAASRPPRLAADARCARAGSEAREPVHGLGGIPTWRPFSAKKSPTCRMLCFAERNGEPPLRSVGKSYLPTVTTSPYRRAALWLARGRRESFGVDV